VCGGGSRPHNAKTFASQPPITTDRSYEDLFKEEIARRGLSGGSVTSSRDETGALYGGRGRSCGVGHHSKQSAHGSAYLTCTDGCSCVNEQALT